MVCEAGLLPGALIRNGGLTFVSRPALVRVERTNTPFATAYRSGAIFQLPAAHGKGRHVAPPEKLCALDEEGQVVARCVDSPNGAVNDVAGVTNAAGSEVGILPYSERAADPVLGVTDGAKTFLSVVQSVALSRGGVR
jgi:phosphoribosylformylglycinamidine (FGAM) synthase-like amidotransferase family enzyme